LFEPVNHFVMLLEAKHHACRDAGILLVGDAAGAQDKPISLD
jgi:hypothetical protein